MRRQRNCTTRRVAYAGRTRRVLFVGIFNQTADVRNSLCSVDLYLRHISDPINAVFSRVFPLTKPTRSDSILRICTPRTEGIRTQVLRSSFAVFAFISRNQNSKLPLSLGY